MGTSTAVATDRIYIDGAWTKSDGDRVLEVRDAATEEVIATVPDGTESDVDRAVDAADRAFDGWSQTSVAERAALLERLADGLDQRRDELARVIAREVGAPLRFSMSAQVAEAVQELRDIAEIARGLSFEEMIGSARVVREPIGVVAGITPWNFPLCQVTWKLAPALAAGCTFVLKPTEVAPLSAYIVAEVADSIGLPRGVFNLVMGTGPVVGEALARHPKVAMVSFTGSTRAGKRVAELASATVKRVALELGGKSANVILEDADLSTAVRDGVADAFWNCGQTCSALTRMLVPRDRLREAEQLVAEEVQRYPLIDPMSDGDGLGPVISDAQRDRVVSYIRKGEEEGARLVVGGAERPAGFEQGYYVTPTVFSDVTPEMTIAREEIFGPVLSLMPHDGEDDAVRIANDSIYGLSAAVWSGDSEHAEAVARRLRAGTVRINGGALGTGVPFGGYKQSGNGRENSHHGIEEFLEIKALLR
jgi:aldehyde dehydrogenase (NAD+)